MRVGLGLDFLKSVPGEGREEAWQLVKALVDFSQEHHFVALTCRGEKAPVSADNLKIKRSLMAGGRVSRTIWENFIMPYRIFNNNIEIFFSMSGAFSKLSWTPFVLYVRDILPLIYPFLYNKKQVSRLKIFLPPALERSKAIIVPSQRTKNDLVQVLKADPSKIEVIHPIISDCWTEIKDKNVTKGIKEKYQLPQRFLLHIGSPRKIRNMEAEFKGFFAARLNAKLPHHFVAVCKDQSSRKSLEGLIHGLDLKPLVHWIGDVPEKDLVGIVNLADAYINLSLGEGHGGMLSRVLTCGVPVICSEEPAFREAVGESALFVPPSDLPALRETLEDVLGNHQDWERWRDTARRFPKPLPTSETAAKVLNILLKVHAEFYNTISSTK